VTEPIKAEATGLKAEAAGVKAEAQVVTLEGSLFTPDIDKLLEPLRKKITEVAKFTGDKLKAMGPEIVKSAQAGFGVAQQKAGAAAKAVGDFGNRAATAGRQLGTTVAEGARRGFDAAKQGATTAAKAVGDVGSRAATAGRQLATSIGDNARRGFEAARQGASAAARAVSDLGSRAVNAGKQLSGAVAQNAKKGFDAARQGATTAAGAVSRFATSARGVASSVAGAARALGQLALGYARSAAQAVIATVRTIAMTVAQKAIAIATRLWAAMQALLNIAMRMNPLALIITGIMLLVGLFVLAYQRSETFRTIVQAVMKGVSTAIGWVVDIAKTVFNWIKSNWPLLLAILTGPIGLAVLAIIKNWDNIKAGVAAVKDWIVSVWNSVIGFFSGLPGRISEIGGRMWDGLKSAFRGVINFLIDAWNSIDFGIHVHIPSWVPLIGGKGIDIDDIVPDIPRLAAGGVVRHQTGGMLAVLGEGGEDEVVIPLSKLNTVLGSSRASTTVNIHPRPEQSEYEIGRIAAREIAWAAKR
jgi:hypothetical protein